MALAWPGVLKSQSQAVRPRLSASPSSPSFLLQCMYHVPKCLHWKPSNNSSRRSARSRTLCRMWFRKDPKWLLPPPTSILHTELCTVITIAEALSPPCRRKCVDFQDVLLFDPALSLRRCTISLRSNEQSLSVPNSVPGLGGTSISLRSRPSFGRVSAPLPAPAIASGAMTSGVLHADDKSAEIIGYESEVTMWNLRRGRGWPVVKGSVRAEGHVKENLSSESASAHK